MEVEKNIAEELTNEQNDSLTEPDPPEESAMTIQDNGQDESTRTVQNGPVHERCVHGEINAICSPLDRSEVYFSISQPYELQPLSKYFYHEWSEAEHLFKSAIDFAEEMYGDWSPCPSPTPSSIGL